MPRRQIRWPAFDSDPGLRYVRERALAELPLWMSVTEAARLAGMPSPVFSLRFKDLTGVSYNWWNEEIHLEEARRLLCVAYRDIQRIAEHDHRSTLTWDDVIPLIGEKSGFDDLAGFDATFMRHTGLAPSAYRVDAAIIRWEPGLLLVGFKKLQGNQAGAEDALQEALLRTLAKYPGFRGLKNPCGYICRVMLNVATDHLSEAQRFVSLIDESEVLVAAVEPDRLTALLRSERDERRTEELWEAYDNLPAAEREAIDLRVFVEPARGFEEIGAMQGTGPGTAFKRYHQGLAKLREAISGREQLPPTDSAS